VLVFIFLPIVPVFFCTYWNYSVLLIGTIDLCFLFLKHVHESFTSSRTRHTTRHTMRHCMHASLGRSVVSVSVQCIRAAHQGQGQGQGQGGAAWAWAWARAWPGKGHARDMICTHAAIPLKANGDGDAPLPRASREPRLPRVRTPS
jgi:hypothetical protein